MDRHSSSCPQDDDVQWYNIGIVKSNHPIFKGSPAEQALVFVLERSPFAIAILDGEGQVVYANQTHRSILGDLIGQKSSFDTYESKIAAVSEKYPYWEHVTFPIPTDSGQLHGSIFLDQTRLKQAEEAYRVLVEQSLQGLVIVTPRQIKFVNTTIAGMLGYSREELLAFSFEDMINTLIHPDDRKRLETYAIARFAGEAVPDHYECRCIGKDGRICWIELFVSMIEYEGEPAIQAAFADITERKQAAKALEDRERQFKTLAEHSPDLIVRIGQNYLIQYINSAAETLFNVHRGALVKDVFLEMGLSLPELQNWEYGIDQVFSTGMERTVCTQFNTPHGERYFHVRMVPERDTDGVIESVLNIGRDITDIHNAETALKHTEASLRDAQRLARVGSWELQVDTGTLYLSDMIYKILGIPPETIPPLFSHFRRFLHPADRKVFRQVNEAFRKAEPSFSIEHRIIKPDGEIRWIHQRAKAVEYLNSRPVRLVGSMQDITERKVSEEAVRRSEEKYRDMVENISDVLYVVDNNDLISYISSSVTPLFGYRPDEVIGKSFWNFLSNADLPMIRQAYESLPSGNDLTIDTHILKRSGEPVWVTVNVRPVINDGILRGFQGTVTDITVRKQAEENRRYKELFEYVADGVFILDDTLLLREVSERFASKLGYTRAELVNRPLSSLLPEGRRDMITPFETIIAEGMDGHCEIELMEASGTPMLLELSIRSVHYQGNIRYLCISRDITETVALRDQLLLSERFAATGQLAASIAHEINSPLQAIAIMLSMMGDRFQDDPETQDDIRLLTDAFDSIGATVKNLLDLNRPGSQHFQKTNVNEVIEKSTTLIQGALTKQKIQLILRLSGDIRPVKASPQQLSQVLINFINNAVEAMSVQIPNHERSPQNMNHREIAISTRNGAESVIIRVSDTGPGIDSDAIDHIFEPFYTYNKRMGIGIGLSVCHGIIKAHNGSLTARNRPSGGAVFTVILPVDSPLPV